MLFSEMLEIFKMLFGQSASASGGLRQRFTLSRNIKLPGTK
jgi:hypothetical protein